MENNKWVLHFHRVVARGNIRMIKALLETKPDDVSVDAIVRNSLLSNRTVLEYFCEEYVKEPKKNTAEIIKLLLSYGANPLQKQVNGNPLLNTLCLATGKLSPFNIEWALDNPAHDFYHHPNFATFFRYFVKGWCEKRENKYVTSLSRLGTDCRVTIHIDYVCIVIVYVYRVIIERRAGYPSPKVPD